MIAGGRSLLLMFPEVANIGAHPRRGACGQSGQPGVAGGTETSWGMYTIVTWSLDKNYNRLANCRSSLLVWLQ